MTRDQIILATLASSEGDFSPVQIQKALFLLDKKASAWIHGPHFNFRAYDYGPFDATIYKSLSELSEKGLVEVKGDPTSKQRSYTVTTEGRKAGTEVLRAIAPQISQYVADISAFVRTRSFAELVSAVYQEFPDMKANSVFRG